MGRRKTPTKQNNSAPQPDAESPKSARKRHDRSNQNHEDSDEDMADLGSQPNLHHEEEHEEAEAELPTQSNVLKARQDRSRKLVD
jgi:hypothetical protein